MRRIGALLVLLVATAIAGAAGQPVAAAKEPAIVHTAAELAVVGGEIQQPKLVWLKPQTLEQLKRGVVKLDSSQSPVLSPNGAKVAIGSSFMGIRIADVRRMKLLRGSIAKRSGWTVSPIAWLAARRLLALEWSEPLPSQMLIVVDPASRRVLKRISFNGYSSWARAGKLIVALGGEADSIGPARLLVVDQDGTTRSVQLAGIQAGGVMEGSEEEPTYRMASPGLAVDPAIGHAYIVGQTALVADVDLATMAVRYRELTRPASLFARFLDWLQPAAQSKRLNGWERQAVSLGDGKLAVAGSEYDGGANHPSGLELFDLEAGTRRMLAPGASYVQASSGVLLAAGGSWDGRTETESGMGLTAHTYEGEQLWHALGDEAVWWLQMAGGYAFVAGKDAYPPTVRVIDLANGNVQTLRGQLPFFVTR